MALLPNTAERFWIYATAAKQDAAVLRHALSPTSATAQRLLELEHLLQETALLVGKPYHDPAAERTQADWRRQQAAERRVAGY